MSEVRVEEVLPATTAPDGPRLARIDRCFSVAGLVLLAIGLISFVSGAFTTVVAPEPFDLDVNLVAAQRLVDREPLYDADASRADAVAIGGEQMASSYTLPTDGYPSPPSTALLHTPFLVFGHGVAVNLFRVVALAGMVAALGLTASLLPAGLRRGSFTFALGVLVASGALVRSLMLGQGHAFVMLGLAAGLWGVANGRWRIAGVGLGLAAALKISPVILIVYLVIRGRRQILPSAVATVAALAAAAAVVGRPQDLVHWVTDVVPSTSGSTARLLNQSLPGLAARIWSPLTDLDADRPGGVGEWRHLAILILLTAVVGLWRMRRGRPFDPLELAALVLACIAAGPLSWEHYATWSSLAVVLLADPRRWAPLHRAAAGLLAGLLGLAVVLLFPVMEAPSPAAVAADGMLRVTSSPIVLATVLLLGLAFWFLGSGPEVEPRTDLQPRPAQFPT